MESSTKRALAFGLIGTGAFALLYYNREILPPVISNVIKIPTGIVDRVVATTTRGYRNNNPLNIESGQGFVGEVPSTTENRFAVFSAPEYGYRAATRIIDNYKRLHGIGTVQGIIARWAPPSDNNPTDKYIQYVAGKVGVASSAPLALSDVPTMVKLLDAMTRFENGPINPFSPAIIADGIRAARA